MRLLGVELSRLFSRRAVVVLMILGTLAIGAVAAGVAYNARPVSTQELAQAQHQADLNNRYVERQLQKCESLPDKAPRCRYLRLAQAEDFLWREQLSVRHFKEWLVPMSAVAAIVAFLFGATFLGADIASGSVGTQLLFQPSRSRVWLAKAGALAIGGAVFGAVSLALANGALYILARSWDRPVPSGVVGDYSTALVRGVVFTAGAAVVGYALVMIARHTAAALGVIAVYGLVAETLMRGFWQGSERWLLSNHVAAFIGGRFTRELYGDCFDMECSPTVLTFTPEFAAAYLGTGTVIALAVSWLVFQRRDVP